MVSAPPPPPPNKGHSFDAGHVPMTEELDSPKWTLPPVVPIVIAFVMVAVVVAVLLWTNKPQPTVTAAIEKVVAGTPLQNDTATTFVAIHLRLKNLHEKPLYIKSMKAMVKTPQGEFEDPASPATDVPRYMQAVAELTPHEIAPLKTDQKIAQGQEQAGMILVSFPIAKDVFDGREQLTVTLELFDRAHLVLREKK